MMILDTNVVSEITKDEPHPTVVAWLDGQALSHFFTTAVNVAEMLSGIELMPLGRRRSDLSAQTARLLVSLFGDHILPFDGVAASEYADVVARRRGMGRRAESPDCQIAAIARVHEATIVTRNVKDFAYLGLTVVDPWHA